MLGAVAKDNTPLLIGLGIAGAAAWGWFVFSLPPKRKGASATPTNGGGVAQGSPQTATVQATLNRDAIQRVVEAKDKAPTGYNADGLPICAPGYQPVLIGERWACRPISTKV